MRKNENSFVLFSLSQIVDMFDKNVTTGNIAILVSNGDGGVFATHLEGVTVLNNNWYVVFRDVLKQDADCRVQYVIFYWG